MFSKNYTRIPPQRTDWPDRESKQILVWLAVPLQVLGLPVMWLLFLVSLPLFLALRIYNLCGGQLLKDHA